MYVDEARGEGTLGGVTPTETFGRNAAEFTGPDTDILFLFVIFLLDAPCSEQTIILCPLH
jgi:hypothetical protein